MKNKIQILRVVEWVLYTPSAKWGIPQIANQCCSLEVGLALEARPALAFCCFKGVVSVVELICLTDQFLKKFMLLIVKSSTDCKIFKQ